MSASRAEMKSEIPNSIDELNPKPEAVRTFGRRRVVLGGAILFVLLGICVVTLPWTLRPSSDLYYDGQRSGSALLSPQGHPVWLWFGSSKLGQSLMGQCLAGGVISLTIGIAAAAISVVLGVTVGLVSGYQGGWIDSLLMRTVDVLY